MQALRQVSMGCPRRTSALQMQQGGTCNQVASWSTPRDRGGVSKWTHQGG